MKHCGQLLYLAFVCLTLFTTSASGQQSVLPKPAVPLDPIAAILDAFKTHQIVALGEGAHGNVQGAAFRLSLIRDPRFAATVNDIVVESGNSRYQDEMDRFIRGEDVPDDVLRRTWQDTTQPNAVWDRTIYEDFFRAVRAMNAKLPVVQRLRVLLGDPPMEWDKIHGQRDVPLWQHWMNERDSYPADLIQREVLAKRRHALLIYGDGHLWRKGLAAAPSLIDLLPSDTAFNIATPTSVELEKVDGTVSTWPRPSVALLHGTALGALEAASYFPLLGHMEDQFDALLYLGPTSAITFAKISPRRCADPGYVKMRLDRMTMVPPPPGSVEQFKQDCLLSEEKK